jgi:hypothetical protein
MRAVSVPLALKAERLELAREPDVKHVRIEAVVDVPAPDPPRLATQGASPAAVGHPAE